MAKGPAGRLCRDERRKVSKKKTQEHWRAKYDRRRERDLLGPPNLRREKGKSVEGAPEKGPQVLLMVQPKSW